jgi:hypothetical protein
LTFAGSIADFPVTVMYKRKEIGNRVGGWELTICIQFQFNRDPITIAILSLLSDLDQLDNCLQVARPGSIKVTLKHTEIMV